MSFFFADTTPEEVLERRDLEALLSACLMTSSSSSDDDFDEEEEEARRTSLMNITSLLEKRPSLLSMELDGLTPLLAATSANNLKAMDVLRECAIREGVSLKDLARYESIGGGEEEEDWTALIVACRSGYEKAAKKLCEEYGADVDQITKIGGKTALMAACEGDKPEIVVALKEKYGADVNLEVRRSSRIVGAGDGKEEEENDDETEEAEEALFYSNAMLHACANNAVASIHALNHCGANLDFENEKELFPILVASQSGATDAVETLIALGADANAWGMTTGLSPLLVAVMAKDEKTAKVLVEQGKVDVNVCGPLGRTIFCEAAARGDVDAMKLCRKLGGRLTLETHTGRTPLHDAAIFNNAEACAWLCERGARVDRENALGETAMSEAALHGAADAMRFLKAKGGSVDFETSTGVMPILNASLNEHTTKALKFLVTELKADPRKRNRFGENCLTVCSRENNVKGIKVCVEVFEMDVNDDNEGTSELPLVSAARGGAIDAVWKLCELGVDVNKVAKKTNDFALGVAAKNAYWRVCAELYKKGADVFLENGLCETPLHCAALSDDEDTIACLLGQCGAVVDHQNGRGETALYFAARENKVNATLALLSHGAADGLTTKEFAYTPLMIAIENKNIECVEVLLEAGASVLQVDASNETAAMKAARAQNCEALRRIIEIVDNESDLHKYLSIESTTGETALTIASKLNYVDIVEILLDFDATLLTQETNASSSTALVAAVDGDAVATLEFFFSRLLTAGDESDATLKKIAKDIVDYENKLGHTALIKACLLGHQDCVRVLLETNLCDANRESQVSAGEASVTLTPLLAAIEGKNARPIVSALFEKGCDINYTNRDGVTAVMHAASLGRTQIIVSLAGYGGDVNQATLKSMCEETRTSKVGEEKAIKLEEPSTSERDAAASVARNSALIAAVLSKSYDVVESLELSVPERDVEVNNTTALLAAIEDAEDEKMVRLLVTLGEDPAFETKDGRTPLSVAFMSGKYDIAKFLLKQQSKMRRKLHIDSQNRDGLTVLSILALAGKNEGIKSICAAPFNANPNFVDRNGRTALTLAARYADELRAGPFPCVWRNGDKALRVDPKTTFEVLLSVGAKIDQETPLPHAYSAIHEAAKYCKDKTTIGILIGLGADPNAIDSLGFTPLMRAVEFGNLVACEGLCEHPKTKKDKVLPRKDGRRSSHGVECAASQSALTLAVTMDNPNNVVQKMLDLGCDYERETLDGNIAIYVAANSGNLSAMRALLSTQSMEKKSLHATVLCQIASGDASAAEPCRTMLGFPNTVDSEVECPVQKQTAIVCACFSGHEEIVQSLVESGANVDSFGSNGIVPIVAAIRRKRHSLVNYLISKKCEINMIPTAFESPLRAAVKANDSVTISACLNAGADIEEIDATGLSLLQEAGRLGNISALKTLIARGAAVNKETPRGSALIVASLAKQVESIEVLKSFGARLDAETSNDDAVQIVAATVNDSNLLRKLNELGATMNFETRDGRTPLNVASREGNVDAVKTALDSGATVDYENRFGETALVLGLHAEREETCKILRERGANINFENTKGETFLMMAARENDVKKCERLISKGALIDKVSDKHGFTALMRAAEFGSVDAARFLIDKGAKLYTEATKGRNALSVALKKGEVEILKLLARAGHEIEAENSHKLTPLCVASASGDLRAMACLLDLGAIVNKESSAGITPLCAASEKGRVDAIHLLCDRGATLDYECEVSGETALIIAAKNGRPAAIRALVERGANVDLESFKLGMTALGAAAVSGAFSSVHALTQVGASVNYSGESNGKTALIHAAEYDDPEAISVLLEVNCAIDYVSGFGASNRHCALTAAAKVGAVKSLKFLLDNNANAFVEPTIGRTALVEAVDNNQLEAIEFLATSLKEKDYETTARYTALVKAAMNKNIDAIKVLRKCGENVNYETSTGDTALLVASRHGNVAMLEELFVPSDDQDLSNEAAKKDVRRECVVDYESVRNGETALIAATLNNHIDCIKFLRREGAVFDRFNHRGCTALFACCGSQDTTVEVLESLLSNGCSADIRRNNDEATPLFSAAESGRNEFVSLLIREGADIEHVDRKTGLNALAVAIQNDRVSVVQTLVDANVNVGFELRTGETALTLAVRFGRTTILEILVSAKSKCDVNKETSTGIVPLHLAAATGRFECVEVLAKAYGSDVNLESKMFKETALICATKSGNSEMCKRLIEFGGAEVDFVTKSEGISALMVACSINEPDVIRTLIDLGADPELEDECVSKQTALQACVKASAIDSIVALIECGADPNLETSSTGFTALLTAAELNLPECCKTLVTLGADPNYETKARGFTALSVAAASASHDAIKRLIALGASVNNEDAKYGRTALISAAIGVEDDELCAATCELLIQENAQIDLEANFAMSPEMSKRPQTALMSAAGSTKYKTRELTLRRLAFLGAKLNFETVEGDTAVLFASREKNFENLEILVKALGADVDFENKFTLTPLMSCLEYDLYESCAKLLKLGADPFKENRFGHHAMSVAAKCDSRSSILCLQKDFKLAVDVPSKMTGDRPLDVAVSFGARDATKLLLSLGADVNAINSITHETALMQAAKSGQIECLALLLRQPHSAKTKLVNVNGDTALTLAATHGRLDCVNALIEKLEEANEVLHETKKGDTALTLAIENGHEKVVSSLCLEGKARIEYESNSGKTALLAAVSADRPEMIRLLASLSSKQKKQGDSNKVSLDCVDYETSRNAPEFVTALHFASLMHRRNACIEALVGVGANVDGELSNDFSAKYGNYTPLMCAALTDNVMAIYQLTELGANINRENAAGVSPLMLACENCTKGAYFALLKKGANPRFETRLGENALTASFAPDNSEMLELIYHSLGSVRDEESIITGATPLIHAFNSPCCTEAVPTLLRLGENIAHETRDSRTALIAAALSGVADRVALCLRSGAKVDQETRTGATAMSAVIEKLGKPIQTATEETYQEDINGENVLKFLLTNAIDKANVDYENKNGVTPAMFAARAFSNNPRVLALLLDHGADKNVETSKGSTLLLDALQFGCDDVVDLLIAEGVDVNYETRKNTAEVLTPLILAAKRGSVFQIEQLLAAGADINYETQAGETALMAAVSASRAEHVSALMSIGNADANYEIKHGKAKGDTAIVLAGRLGHKDVIQRLISSHNVDPSRGLSDKMTPLIRAVVDEDADAVKHMLLAGVPINVESAEGYTPLVEAAKKPSRIRCLEVLCDFDASIVDFETSRGFSALHEACKTGNEEAVLSLCLKYGANSNRENARDATTPLMTAAEYGQVQVVETLIKKCSADVNRETVASKHTVFTHCAFRGKTSAFSALVSNGALVDRETQDGRTAVLYAIARDDAKTVEALVKVAGADVEFDSSLGVTPLVGAATANKPKCVQILLSLGAKPLQSSRSNKVPVLQACLMGSIEVMKVLPSGADFWDSDPLGNGETPLFCAAQKGKDVAKVAIACGASVSYEPKSTKRTALAMSGTITKRSRAFDVLVALGGVATSVCGSGETALDVAFANNCDWCAPNILVYTASASDPNGDVNYVSTLTKETALMYCCRRGLVDGVKALIKFPGIDVNYSSARTSHRTALIAACDRTEKSPLANVVGGDIENTLRIVESLVNDARADVDFETETGKTALIVAATNNDDDVIRKLVDVGASVNRENKFGISAFSASIEASADAAGALLVELGADAHAGDKVSHDTPLIRAVRIGDVDAANYILVKTKADPNTETEVSGETALLVACRNVDVPMVELLLKSGADASQKSSVTRLSPLEALCTSCASTEKADDLKNIANMLLATSIVDPSAIDKVTLETPLMVAAKHGDALGVECLIKYAKVDVNDERTGRTALIRACGCGDVAAPAVEKLLQLGADASLDVTLEEEKTSQVEKVGDTAVHAAVRSKSNAKIFIALASRGQNILNVESSDQDGLTPLQLAASLNRNDAMSHLIAANAKVDAESRINEHTALTYCANTDNATAMIHLVKKCGASVDNETSAHETALMVALKTEKWQKVTDALLNNLNASAILETSSGDSPVTVAFETDDEDKILKVLRDGKVDVNKYPFTTAGETMFGMCARRNCAQAVSSISKFKDTEFSNINLNLTDATSGNTALCLAAALGHSEVARALIVDAGADASFAPIENGKVDPLCDACAACPVHKLLATIKVLIKDGKVNGSLSKTEAGWTPLMLLADRPSDFEGEDESVVSAIIDYLVDEGRCEPTRIFDENGAANGYHAFSWSQLRKNIVVRDALSKYYLEGGGKDRKEKTTKNNVSDVTALRNFFNAIAKDDAETVEGLLDVKSVRDASVSFVLDDSDGSNERVKAILHAVRCGANKSIKVLAKRECNLDGDGVTIPIVEATFLGKLDVVKTLASVGANVNLCSKTHDGANACAMAALVDRDDILRLLCQDFRADLNAANCESSFETPTFKTHDRPLHLSALMFVATRDKGAASRRHALECLVNRGAVADFEAPESGETACTLLARLNRPDVICELAVVSKINANRESTLFGFTPLIAAAENNGENAVRVILEHLNASVHLENSRGDTAILAACRNGSVGALKVLLEYAAQKSSSDDIFAVDEQGKILLNNSYGVHPIIAAAMGANKTSKNAFEGVLDVLKRNEKIFAFDPNCEAFNGQTALTTLFVDNQPQSDDDEHAISELRKKAKVLLRYAADASHENAFGKTSLDVVVENDDCIGADILLTDLNVQPNRESTKTGYTALMLCSEFASLKCCETLCRKGADVAQLSSMLECDAMDIAHHRNHTEIKQCLVSFGAIPIAEDE